MRFIREHITFRLFWLFIALNILNCSVDTPDLCPDSVHEDLSFNDQESVIEIVLEQVFRIDNAIVEFDENDTEDGSGFTAKEDIDFFVLQILEKKLINEYCLSISSAYNEKYLLLFPLEIVPPPPKG